jgi:predicted HAD superfamily Cof-like phosphohydrolase
MIKKATLPPEPTKSTESITEYMHGCISDFQRAFQYENFTIASATKEVLKLRSGLIKEEAHEYDTAEDLIEELDALCDLLYVVIGTNVALSIPVARYTSGQLKMNMSTRPAIQDLVQDVTQELDCMFPCPRRLPAGLDKLSQRLVDIAAQRGYDLFNAFTAVHLNNMGKLWTQPAIDPNLVSKLVGRNQFLVKRRVDGKVIKPANHKKVDLRKFIP